MTDNPEAEVRRKEFGRRVRRRRMACGWSQVDLATKSAVPQAAISRIESGGYQALNLTVLTSLANVLCTTVDYLLQRTDEAGAIPENRECLSGR